MSGIVPCCAVSGIVPCCAVSVAGAPAGAPARTKPS